MEFDSSWEECGSHTSMKIDSQVGEACGKALDGRREASARQLEVLREDR